MEDRRIDPMRESAQANARRIADSAQDAASKAGSYMQARIGRVSERAQDYAQEANDQIERVTGNSSPREPERVTKSAPSSGSNAGFATG